MCYWFRQDEPWESETCKYAIRHLRIALTIDSPAFGDGGGIDGRNVALDVRWNALGGQCVGQCAKGNRVRRMIM